MKLVFFIFHSVFFTVVAASATTLVDAYSNKIAVITKFSDEQHLYADTDQADWQVGEIVAVFSQNASIGTIAFVEVDSVREKANRTYELKLALMRQSRKYFLQVGDFVRRLDLTTNNMDYLGTTDLLIRESRLGISSKYKPFVYQGIVIGDTAQTLYDKEFLINYLGNSYYGLTSRVTVGTFIPSNFTGQPNANFRIRIYDSDSTTLTSGLSFVQIQKDDQSSLNLNFYWDNTSSEALISHTFLGLGLVKWDKASEASALKYLTSSSFQTGYEVVLDDWDRFLIGPSYNFASKALGGYLSYVWIWDRFHMQASINATDVTHLRLSPTDGFYGFFDMYWRF